MRARPFRRHPADREILRLGLPALGALAAEPLYVLVDTAVVGHIGTAELGGVAVAGALLGTGFALFNFLAYGTTSLVARALGAGDDRAAAAHATGAAWTAAAIGAVLVVAGLVGAWSAARATGVDATVLPHALTYLRISALGFPAVLLSLAGMGYVRGLQDTRTPLVVALAANAFNLVLELWLVFGLGLGVAGSAWATVVAQWAAAAAFLAMIVRGVRRAGASLRPERAALRVTAVVGGHLVLRTGSLLVALMVATAVAARIGVAALGAHQIAFQIWTFLALVLDAVAIAAQAMVGRLVGAGDVAAARAASLRMLQWGVGAGLVLGAAVAAARPALAALFTADAAVRAGTGSVLLLVALLQPVAAAVFVLDGVLIGAGDMRFLAGAMLASLAVFLPAAALVALAGGGLLALWGTIGLWIAARLAGVGGRFAGGRWSAAGAPGR